MMDSGGEEDYKRDSFIARMTAAEVWASPLSTGEMATRPVSRFRTRLFPLELEPALPQVSNEDLKNGNE